MVNFSVVDLSPGLYFVATPIGTARDITLRALDLLASADILVAEDTRSLRRLMQIHGVPLDGRRVLAYHDHSRPGDRDAIVKQVIAGRSVVYAPEAGTAMVSDPGFMLGRAVVEAGGEVTAAPGPSALLAALTVSGLPSDRFLFAGFPPQKAGPRAAFFAELATVPATIVFYAAPKRVRQVLEELCVSWGDKRPAVLCRELTKRFEETMRGTLRSVRERLGETDPRGECVLLVGPPVANRAADPEGVAEALDDALTRLSVRDAAAEVAEMFGLPRRTVYQDALSRQRGGTE
ncbi:MAG: 16S rRNA (cytidine(1402)-2'-O)-methyltransferase [Pseudomonadota bacterium]